MACCLIFGLYVKADCVYYTCGSLRVFLTSTIILTSFVLSWIQSSPKKGSNPAKHDVTGVLQSCLITLADIWKWFLDCGRCQGRVFENLLLFPSKPNVCLGKGKKRRWTRSTHPVSLMGNYSTLNCDTPLPSIHTSEAKTPGMNLQKQW